eukprot:Rmarinus@m.28932
MQSTLFLVLLLVARISAAYIGVDVGSERINFAAFENGKQIGFVSVPSIAAYSNGQWVFGVEPEEVESQLYTSLFVGRDIDHSEALAKRASLPYSFDVEDGTVQIVADNRDAMRPEEVLAKLFRSGVDKMNFVSSNPIPVTISVPGHWDDEVRNAIATAASSAGLKVLDVASDYLCYAAQYLESHPSTKNIIVYHAGSVDTSAALLTARDGLLDLKVEQIEVDDGAGSVEVDVCVAELLGEQRRSRMVDNQRVPTSFARGVKKALATSTEATFQGDAKLRLPSGKLTRSQFEDRCRSILMRLAGPGIKIGQRESGADIDVVILAGETSHIPLVETTVMSTFHAVPSEKMSGAEAAFGAAVLASVRDERGVEKRDVGRNLQQSTESFSSVEVANDLSVSGSSSFVGDMVVSGDVTLGENEALPVPTSVVVKGTTTFEDSAAVLGEMTVGGNFTSSGGVFASSVEIADSASVGGPLVVGGDAFMQDGTFEGSVTVTDSLSVSGSVVLGASSSDVFVNGGLHVQGDGAVEGAFIAGGGMTV